MAVELSYCVVNTEARELLLRCLDAIAAEQATLAYETEVLVLDNASRRRLRQRGAPPPGERRGHRARAAPRQGRERLRAAAARARAPLPAAQRGLRAAARRHAGAARRARRRPGRRRRGRTAAAPRRRAAAVGVALSDAAHGARRRAVPAPPLHRAEPRRAHARGRLGAVGGAARAARGGRADRLVRSRLLRLLRRGRLLQAPARAGWRTLYVPRRRGLHHEQLSTGAVPERRIVELSRNRDRYMRKHHSAAAAWAVRWLTALTYAARALAALALPGHDPRRYWRHVTATLRPAQRRGSARGGVGAQPRQAAVAQAAPVEPVSAGRERVDHDPAAGHEEVERRVVDRDIGGEERLRPAG